MLDPGPLTTSVHPAAGHAGRFVNTYAPWASVVVDRIGRVLVIVTVAPASGTLFVPDEPPGANGRSRVIVPWSTRWAEAGAIACRSAALTRTTEPVRAGTLTFVERHLDTVLDQHDTELLTHRKGTPRRHLTEREPVGAEAARSSHARRVEHERGAPVDPDRDRRHRGRHRLRRQDLAREEQLILDRAGLQVERRRARVGTERERAGDDTVLDPGPLTTSEHPARACREVREHVRTLGVGRRGAGSVGYW